MAFVNCTKKYFFLLTFFGQVLTILAWNKCRLVTKQCTFYHTFPFMPFSYKGHLNNFYTNSSCPAKIICYLFKFMRMLNISKAHSLKFPKSPNVHYKHGIWESCGMMDCPELITYTLCWPASVWCYSCRSSFPSYPVDPKTGLQSFRLVKFFFYLYINISYN